MGVKLDWQVEAERVHNRVGEDPRSRRRRRLRRLRVTVLILAATLVMGTIGALILSRLSYVEGVIERSLLETVQAEIAALRIGNYPDFIALQRSSSDAWFQVQTEKFYRYQDLKSSAGLNLTGVVSSIAVDSQRGRVVLEEVLNGVLHQTVWFYWRYTDGWRHVPSDLTFWGETSSLKTPHLTVNYHTLDTALAGTLSERAERWIVEGCALLACETPPVLTFEIIPDPGLTLGADPNRPDTILIPSPLASLERARADQPISASLEDQIALEVVHQLMGKLAAWADPAPGADAAWLRASLVESIVSSFTGRSDPARSAFMESLKGSYGTALMGRLARELKPDSTLTLLASMVGTSVAQLAVDWRPFFQWRLDIEKTLLTRGDQYSVIALWDAANPASQDLLRARLNDPSAASAQVIGVSIAPGGEGVARAVVQVTVGDTPGTLIWRLVEGTWKRSG